MALNKPTQPPAQRRKGDLVRSEEIARVLDTLRAAGVPIGAIDIRRDGVTVHPADSKPGNDFDNWVAKDASRDRSARRQ